METQATPDEGYGIVAIHPKDIGSDNPRIQCDCCGKWKRLHTKKNMPPFDVRQSFMGGCSVDGQDDHTAAGKSQDICNECCVTYCKKGAK